MYVCMHLFIIILFMYLFLSLLLIPFLWDPHLGNTSLHCVYVCPFIKWFDIYFVNIYLGKEEKEGKRGENARYNIAKKIKWNSNATWSVPLEFQLPFEFGSNSHWHYDCPLSYLLIILFIFYYCFTTVLWLLWQTNFPVCGTIKEYWFWIWFWIFCIFHSVLIKYCLM